MAISVEEVFETVNMTMHQNFDIRTATLGINLKDCMDRNTDKFCARIKKRIIAKGKMLNEFADKIEARGAGQISVPPFREQILRVATTMWSPTLSQRWTINPLSA